MLDLGWSELLMIGVVALIVVGPRDLPKLFRSLGRITARARSMAREFSSALEDAARDSGLDEASRSINDLKSVTSKKALGLDALDRAAERFEKWEPSRTAARATETSPPAASSGPAPGAQPDPGAEPPTAPATGAPAEPSPSASGQRRLHAVRRQNARDDS